MDSAVEAKLNRSTRIEIDGQTAALEKVGAKHGGTRAARAKAPDSISSIVLMEHSPAAGSTTSKQGGGVGEAKQGAPSSTADRTAPRTNNAQTTLGAETKISTGRSEMWKKAISLSPPPSEPHRGKSKPQSSSVSGGQVRRRGDARNESTITATPPTTLKTPAGAANTKLSDKFGQTVTRAKQIGGVIIRSKLLVAVLVFLSTALLLILLKPPMAQETPPDGDGAAITQRSWRKIMIWSSLACVFALILPYTCGRAATGDECTPR